MNLLILVTLVITIKMKLAIITSTTAKTGELDKIRQLAAYDIHALHIRRPKLSKRELREFIGQIPKSLHPKIVLHQHYSLVKPLGLMGIHLDKKRREEKFRNRAAIWLRRMLNSRITICSTFHSYHALKTTKLSLDYAFLTSIFTAHSHFTQEDPSGLNLLKSSIEQSGLVVLALGGIDESRIPLINAAGFQGAGISRRIWEQKHSVDELLAPFLKS